MKEDFDKDKVQGLTFVRWAAIYLERYAKDKRSVDEDRRHIRVLSEFLGNLLLSQITKAKVEEFKQLRRGRLTYRGTAVSAAYCNRELEVLRHMLRLAAEEEIIPVAPAVRLFKQNNARERVLSEEEYQRLLAVSSLHLRRIIVCAFETGMRAGEIKKLTWDKVDFKTGFIRLAAEDTKTNEKRAIPLSSVLREILEDIRKEQREGKVAPIGGHVFTWGGRAMKDGSGRFRRPAAKQRSKVSISTTSVIRSLLARSEKAGTTNGLWQSLATRRSPSSSDTTIRVRKM